MKLAGCIIRDKDNRILLLHRNTDKHQQWEVPGGKVEDGEEPQATAMREVKEETGVDVQIIQLLGHQAFTEGERTFDYSYFLAEIVDGEISVLEPETFDDAKHFSIGQMRHLNLSTGASTFLNMVQKGEIEL